MKLFSLVVFFLSCSLLSSCGQNFGIEKERAYNERMEKEVVAMRNAMQNWAKKKQAEIQQKKKTWQDLPLEVKAAKRDSTARYMVVKIDSSAVALEKWVKKNGPKAAEYAKGFAAELKSWEKTRNDIKNIGNSIGKWADELAVDAREATKHLKEGVEKKRADNLRK